MPEPTPLDLAAFMRDCQQRTQTCLERELKPDDRRYGPLLEAMAYACLEGGKRIRPVLVYGAAQAVGASLVSADAPACAVELLHCYSLVHDDLPAMDDDDLRRGRPTVHKAFDEATAILVGDALQSLAFDLLARTTTTGPDCAARLQMVQTLAHAVGAHGMVGGQMLDCAAAGQTLDLTRLEAMHRLKTGALIRASVRLGALCQPAITEAQLQALDHYADCLGLAFQVHDDVLDVTTDTATLGKPQGSDAANGKPTYSSLLGLEAARQHALRLARDAVDALRTLGPDADPLRALAGYVVQRAH